MGRINEAAAYAMFALEAALNNCAATNQPVSADGVVAILKDIRFLKCGLLERNEVQTGGALSSVVITRRIMLRLPR